MSDRIRSLKPTTPCCLQHNHVVLWTNSDCVWADCHHALFWKSNWIMRITYPSRYFLRAVRRCEPSLLPLSSACCVHVCQWTLKPSVTSRHIKVTAYLQPSQIIRAHIYQRQLVTRWCHIVLQYRTKYIFYNSFLSSSAGLIGVGWNGPTGHRLRDPWVQSSFKSKDWNRLC